MFAPMGSATTLEVQGTQVPRLGFGTWQIVGPECVTAVRDALEMGYRHVDTARAYDNEREVGAGLAAAGVPREDVFLTTKVWMDDAAPDRVRASAESSLRDLAVDYVDLLLLHWPQPRVPVERTLEAMMALRDAGAVRHIGVSNFPAGLLRRAVDVAPVFCNQVEYHPYLGQDEILALAEEHDFMVTAYAPLGHGAVPDDPVLEEIGAAHGKTGAQVALRWLVDQPRVTTVPKAASHENRAANFDIWDFELSHDERERIDSLPKDRREFDPAWAPDWAA
jgi:2,5-diketo-D-gluconate reductase B